MVTTISNVSVNYAPEMALSGTQTITTRVVESMESASDHVQAMIRSAKIHPDVKVTTNTFVAGNRLVDKVNIEIHSTETRNRYVDTIWVITHL